jgi:two-component system phosphate regulon sensor histidine kinase PhoR
LISFLVSIFLANNFSRRVTQHITTLNDSLSRVKDGNTMLNSDDYPYDELKDMVTKINALALDISMHIEKLQDEKEKIAFIMDNMNEGFILLDSRQTTLLINGSACMYLDCKKTAVGENITHCTRNYQFLQMVDDAMQCCENRSMDMKLDGQVIETTFTYVNPRQGMDDAGLIITMTDVTERRNAVQMRRDFFSNASHELKTPITSIKGGAELLCSDVPLDAEQRSELLTRIRLESDKMSMLINDVIMISRIESGEIMADREDVDFEQVVQECCAEVLSLIEQNQVLLNMDLESAMLFANRKNLHELASNLLVNAIKYNKPGGSVDVFLESYVNEVILTVRNDGEPIPIDCRSRIFERFFRVDRGRSKNVGGTGLGLSIVKHVVDSMNGTILLESNEKDGTTFVVRLPKE